MTVKNSIIDLIEDYQKTANEVVKVFQKKYKVSNLLEGWHAGFYEQTGSIKELGIEFYAFHGIGLAAEFKNKSIDFDFAFFPEIKWNGFDKWRLAQFVENQPVKYKKFLNSEVLETEFGLLFRDQLIKKPTLDFSTNLFFWTKDLTKLN